MGRAHDPIIVRTCVVDERVRAAVEGGLDEVLTLGAGLCTRPYRLGLPVAWAEADLPEIIAHKARRATALPSAPAVRRFPLDVRDPQALARSLEGPRRLLVVMEGLVVYLEPERVSLLLSVLARRAGSTRVIFDLGGGLWSRLFSRRTGRVVRESGAPYRTTLSQGRSALRRAGFRVVHDQSLVDWDAASRTPRFVRPLSAYLVPGFADTARVLDAEAG